MTRFLRLSSVIINTAYIKKINIEHLVYKIHIANGSDGSIGGSGVVFWGNFSSDDEIITISSDKNKEDYDLMEKELSKDGF